MQIDSILQQGEGISVEYKRCSRQLPESFFQTVRVLGIAQNSISL